MKTTLILVLMLLMFKGVQGQNQNDTESVLEKCMTIPEIQMLRNDKGSNDRQYYYIWQEKITLQLPVNRSEFGKRLYFMNVSQLKAYRTKFYYSFTKFNISGNLADVVLDFYFHQNGIPDQGMISVSMKLEKSGLVWNIVESAIERR